MKSLVTELPGLGPYKLHRFAAILTKGPGRSTRPGALFATACFVVGGFLVLWSAAIHLDLWTIGYQDIPTIGSLFLAQFAGGLLVGLLVVGVRQLWVALIGAGFAAMTMGGFLVSVYSGLFGFSDSWDAPFAQQAFAIECAALALLLLAGWFCLRSGRITELD